MSLIESLGISTAEVIMVFGILAFSFATAIVALLSDS